jgi:hypothetical protein
MKSKIRVNMRLKTTFLLFLNNIFTIVSCDLYNETKISSNNSTTSLSETNVTPINSIICDTNNDCYEDNDKNRVCVDNICQCFPDFKWDQTSNTCTYSTCFNYNDCQTYDNNRICDRNGFCICKKGYAEDANSKVCDTSMISQLWFCIQVSVSIFVPLSCLFLAAVMYYREKKRKRNIVPLLNVVK